MDEIKGLLQYVFQTQNQLTLPVSAPGSAGMETAFVNLLEPGDKVVICQKGVFGGRMKENASRCGAIPVMVEDEWGKIIDCDKVEDAFKENPDAKALAFVHAETSTGARSDATLLCGLAQKYGCLSIVDSVGIDLCENPLKDNPALRAGHLCSRQRRKGRHGTHIGTLCGNRRLSWNDDG